MTRKEKFVHQLNNFERVEISSFHRKRKLLLLVILSSLVLSHTILALNLFPSIIPLLSIFVSFVTLTKIVITVDKSISSAAIKGDSLILKNAQNVNCVTSVKSIRKMKAKRIGKTTVTSIQFNLDGSKRKAILLSDNSEFIEPYEAIRSAQRLFKK
ncbi:MAG: hypothetical protein RI922_2007 [Bacteroidota bacterium]|jgi:hypothetical protein